MLKAVRDPNAQLFEEIFQIIARELPPIPRFDEEGNSEIRQEIPTEPLCVTTVLYEDEIGNIRPIITDEDIAWVAQQDQQQSEWSKLTGWEPT